MEELKLMPLHIILLEMRKRWKAADYDGAISLAKIAAPYLHAKAPAARQSAELAGVTDDELDRFERSGGAGTSGEDPGESA